MLIYSYQKSFAQVPPQDVAEIGVMYKESINMSYYSLWQENKDNFAQDILNYGTTPELAISAYSEKVAKLTLQDWKTENLTSIIASERDLTKRSIIGFALLGVDKEVPQPQLNEIPYYLYYIGVAPSHFQLGVGSEIISRVFKDAQEMCPENYHYSIKLHTRNFNLPAIKLYEKFGFSVEGNNFTHGHNPNYLCFAFKQPELQVSSPKQQALAIVTNHQI
jgi:ribosomal protein S18 acetylase RimI-like enzyme